MKHYDSTRNMVIIYNVTPAFKMRVRAYVKRVFKLNYYVSNQKLKKLFSNCSDLRLTNNWMKIYAICEDKDVTQETPVSTVVETSTPKEIPAAKKVATSTIDPIEELKKQIAERKAKEEAMRKAQEEAQAKPKKYTITEADKEEFLAALEAAEKYEREVENRSNKQKQDDKERIQERCNDLDSLLFNYTRTGMVAKSNNEAFMSYTWELYEDINGMRNILGVVGYNYNRDEYFYKPTRSSSPQYVTDAYIAIKIIILRGKYCKKLAEI